MNLKIAWNTLHEEKQFDYEDEVSSGDLDAEEIVRQLRENQMDEIAQLADKMLDAGVMTQTAHNSLFNEGKVPGKKGFNKKEKSLISDVVEFKSNMKKPLGMNEFEQTQYTKETVKILTEYSHLVRKALSKRLDIKFLPKLTFVEDNSFEYAEKIERLIKKIKNKENDKEKKRYN